MPFNPKAQLLSRKLPSPNGRGKKPPNDSKIYAPNQSRGSDITYVRTHEGFLYLATVLDLFSRHIVGWSMYKNMGRYQVIRALMLAVWKRQPKGSQCCV